MYCPRCGQQQISDEMRFCSRCGLPMGGLAQWINSAGYPVKSEKDLVPMSPRRKGIRQGAKLMFISGIMFPVFLGFSMLIDSGEPLIAPFLGFFIGLAWLLYSRLFKDKAAPAVNQQSQVSGLNPMSASALPPALQMPMAEGRRANVRTKELAEPPSVTENTTRLLDNE